MFHKVTIIGVGLIGGSIGLEMRRRRLARKVVGFGRTQKNLNVALKRGLIDEKTRDIKDAVTDADLVILCAPVTTIVDSLKSISPYLKSGALVMDAGSTKAQIVSSAAKILPLSVSFVGAHPLAGTEKAGASAAIKDLFKGKKCILTPTRQTSRKALSRIRQLWKRLGADVRVMDPKTHDRQLALTSHLPQMVAYSLVGTIGRLLPVSTLRSLAGGGFLDTTRIAGSPSEMWSAICLSNREPLLRVMKNYQKEIGKIIRWIEKRQGRELGRYFERIGRLRRKL